MSLELLNKAEDAGTATFAPEDHVLGLVQRAIKSRADTRIVLLGIGEVIVFPVRGEYFSNVEDMPAFCLTPAHQFESTNWSGAIPASFSTPKPVGDLLWQAAFHASRGRLVEGCSKYDVTQFRCWPNLPRLPVTPNTARICALLTRHPSTIMIVHRILGISKDEVYQNYSAAFCAGIASVKSSSPEAAKVEDSAPVKAPESPLERSGMFRSLFAKISGL